MFAEGIQDYVDRVRRIAAEVNTGSMLDDRRMRYDLLHGFLRPIETSPPAMQELQRMAEIIRAHLA